METVLESDSEEQVRGGETEEEEEEEEEDEEPTTLEQTLNNIHVSAPQELLLNQEANQLCLESYRVNSPSEIRLLAIADVFHRQYSHLYPDRKPLLLCPINECGIKKFVSTTLRPTPAVYPELFSWEGCASFVANFLSLEPLDPPVELPRFLLSSTSVLQSQRATCFEFSTLLCSLLLGAHYDAYCVSGYAVKEMCQLDQSLQECPLLDPQVKSVMSEPEPQRNKYSVKPKKELKSCFMVQEEKKKRDDDTALLQKQKIQEDSGQRSADPLRGLRLHCWVLVLSGSRDVQENFFIDALSGNSYATDNDSFLGIESMWNNFNYYVNMQDCSRGCAGVVYDLEDVQLWEPLLFGATSKKQLILNVLRRKEEEKETIMKISSGDEEEEPPGVFEMPRSWISSIRISKTDLETIWPGGQKVTRYRKAKVEKFAAYLRPDGLITRLTSYKDLDCTEAVMVKEWYQHRCDHLEEREVTKGDSSTTERFKRGRRLQLLFLRRTDTECVMEFSGGRADDLVRRVESSGEMTEIFEGRDDFLCYRRAVYDQKAQLQKVVERFHRNRSKPAKQDVAERVFLLAQKRIELTYHLEDDRIIPSKRSFIKPRVSTETKRAGDFTADMVSSFLVDPSEKPLSTVTLYCMLLDLMEEEEKVVLHIRESKKEVGDILACRDQEDADVELDFCPWTTAGAARGRRQRQEMERLAAEEQRWLQEKKEDILALFLIRLNNNNTGPLSAEDARQLHQDCLDEFIDRLQQHGGLIQERHQKETQELQKKQLWYQKNQLNMTKEQEDEYQTYCSKKTLQIQAIRTRLRIHKQTAPHQIHDVDQKLKEDPRLFPHLCSAQPDSSPSVV